MCRSGNPRLRWPAATAAAALTAACAAPKVAFNPRADFAAVQRVAVTTFTGPQGAAAADLLTQSLVAHGANVMERQQFGALLQEQHLGARGFLDPATVKQLGRILGVDAIFVGSVVESSPSSSYLITTLRRSAVATVTPVSGADVTSEGPVLGIPDSQVVTTAAEVSLVARMVDVQSGSILWSASMDYEGVDVTSAMSSITDAFVHSLAPIWPSVAAK